MNVIPKIKRGEYGYIAEQKKWRLLKTIVSFAIVFTIFLVGWHINKTRNSILTVLCVVAALPAAKMAVSYLVLMKYKTPTLENYTQLLSKIDIDNVLSDLVISSTDKPMHLDFIVVYNSKVYCYTSDAKLNISDTEKYMQSFIKKEYRITALKIFDDFNTFLQKSSLTVKEEREETTQDKDSKIKDMIKIYCI